MRTFILKILFALYFLMAAVSVQAATYDYTVGYVSFEATITGIITTSSLGSLTTADIDFFELHVSVPSAGIEAFFHSNSAHNFHTSGLLTAHNNELVLGSSGALQIDEFAPSGEWWSLTFLPDRFEIQDWGPDTAGHGATIHHPFLWDRVVGISTVPIPPAVWLFGSALLGVAGLSRRQ